MLSYTFSLEMMSPQITCRMYSTAQLQKYKYFLCRGHKVYPSGSTSSENWEIAEKQITVCWTENYTQLLTIVYPTGFPMGLCLQYFKNKIDLRKKKKRKTCFPSFLKAAAAHVEQCSCTLVSVGWALQRSLWLQLTLKGSAGEKQMPMRPLR